MKTINYRKSVEKSEIHLSHIGNLANSPAIISLATISLISFLIVKRCNTEIGTIEPQNNKKISVPYHRLNHEMPPISSGKTNDDIIAKDLTLTQNEPIIAIKMTSAEDGQSKTENIIDNIKYEIMEAIKREKAREIRTRGFFENTLPKILEQEGFELSEELNAEIWGDSPYERWGKEALEILTLDGQTVGLVSITNDPFYHVVFAFLNNDSGQLGGVLNLTINGADEEITNFVQTLLDEYFK